MAALNSRNELPVLLLHNLDPALEPADLDQVLCDVNTLESALREQGHPVVNLPVRDADLAGHLRDFAPEEGIVFNWCESLPGVPYSEALVAQILEDLGYAYTGSPPDVLQFSWDKPRVKALLRESGIPTPHWRIYDSLQPDGWDLFPAIVKPAREHSSMGVSPEAVVLNPDELRARIAYILDSFRQPALVEDFVDGREFHVSLWGNGQVEMLPPAEMDFAAFAEVRDRLCTYDSKFLPGSRHYEGIGLKLPAPLDEAEYDCLCRTASLAYTTLNCRDYARMDIRLRDGIFYVLDVNPNADISAETSTAYAAREAGYSYSDMTSRIVRLAASRHPVFRTEFRH
jgi:D-alanine-D-alanine ligase